MAALSVILDQILFIRHPSWIFWLGVDAYLDGVTEGGHEDGHEDVALLLEQSTSQSLISHAEKCDLIAVAVQWENSHVLLITIYYRELQGGRRVVCSVGDIKSRSRARCSQSHGNSASSLRFPIVVGTVCSGDRPVMVLTAFPKKIWASEPFAAGEAEVRWSLGANTWMTTALGSVVGVCQQSSCSSQSFWTV